MKKYRVSVQDIEVQGVVVEAESEAEAKAKVQGALDNGEAWDKPDEYEWQPMSESVWELTGDAEQVED